MQLRQAITKVNGRPARKTKKKLQDEKTETYSRSVREKIENGIEVRLIPDKGRGLFAIRSFNRGDFVAEYAGELIKLNEARFRERFYASNDTSGISYMYYFKFQDQTYW